MKYSIRFSTFSSIVTPFIEGVIFSSLSQSSLKYFFLSVRVVPSLWISFMTKLENDIPSEMINCEYRWFAWVWFPDIVMPRGRNGNPNSCRGD